MPHHWKAKKEQRRQRKECAGPSCPAPRSKPKRKTYHTPPKPPKTGKPEYDKPASDWTGSTTPKTTPAPPERIAQYTSPSGRSVSMKLPGGKHINTKQIQAMRAASGTVIKKDGKIIHPKARTR